MTVLDNLKEINIEKPANIIIGQIRNLISTGQLSPGDRLPSERKLSEKFGVGRSHVREALRKLEFFGILKTLPQSGTVVAGISVSALEGLINDILELHENDFHSFVETRVILEINAVKLAAERASEEDVEKIKTALDNFRKEVKAGKQGVEEDLIFHVKIAEASGNSVLKVLLMTIIPDLINYTRKLNICGDGRYIEALEEHEKIFKYIAERNPVKAQEAMRHHLRDVLDYSRKNNHTFNGQLK